MIKPGGGLGTGLLLQLFSWPKLLVFGAEVREVLRRNYSANFCSLVNLRLAPTVL